jgi:hypothetical protein
MLSGTMQHESEQQTINRRVEDAMRHAIAREAEYP